VDFHGEEEDSRNPPGVLVFLKAFKLKFERHGFLDMKKLIQNGCVKIRKNYDNLNIPAETNVFTKSDS